jgi:hypothetical protein
LVDACRRRRTGSLVSRPERSIFVLERAARRSSPSGRRACPSPPARPARR